MACLILDFPIIIIFPGYLIYLLDVCDPPISPKSQLAISLPGRQLDFAPSE